MDTALARAVGRDAGNRSMRKAGRTAWNEDDQEAATEAWLKALNAALAEDRGP
jgi:hypothetical protein